MAFPTTQNNFIWHEATPGVWQRDADEAEVLYSSLIKLYEGSGRMQFAMTGHLSLTVDVPGDATPGSFAPLVTQSLRVAWLRLRDEMPTIASRVNWDATTQKWVKVYKTAPSEAAQASWLQSTFKTVLTGQTGVEWANSDPPAPRVPTLFVVIPPQTSSSIVRRDLVFRSPHDIIDGIGTLLLLNRLAALLSSTLTHTSTTPLSLLSGEETCRLSPPYRVAANVPPTPTLAQVSKLNALRAEKVQVPSDPSIHRLTLPFTHGALLPSRHQRVALTLSATQTADLLAALKPLHATPTHAFHAAIAMTMRDTYLAATTPPTNTPPPTHLRYISYLLRNERPACQPPFNTAAHAAAVYHSVSGGQLAVTLPASPAPNPLAAAAEFTDALVQIREHYHAVRDDADHYALAPLLWADAAPSRAVLDTGEVPLPNATPSVSISSMGLIDRLVEREWEEGGVRVYEPWVTGEELGNGLGVFLGTFRGRLEVSAAFNEAWHEREEVEGFLGRVVAVVVGGLGLGGDQWVG